MRAAAIRTRLICATMLFIACSGSLIAQNLKVRLEADRLRVSGPQVRLLTGRPLDRLRNGGSVIYVLELTVRTEKAGRVLTKVKERFTLSYDLWEEKFSVTRQATPTRSASNLSAAAAQAWCLDSLSIPASQLPGDRTFWVELEYQTEGPPAASKSDSNLTLSSLIDIFSRRSPEEQQLHDIDVVGPFHLEDLRKKR